MKDRSKMKKLVAYTFVVLALFYVLFALASYYVPRNNKKFEKFILNRLMEMRASRRQLMTIMMNLDQF